MTTGFSEGVTQSNPQGNLESQGNPQTNIDNIEFRYSDSTPMTEFFKDYPQYSENPNFSKYSTVKSFAEGHEALITKLGTAINIPGEDATPEQLSEFYNKLGRPEAPDKYEFEDKLPEGMEINPQLDTNYRELAHAIGLTTKQAQELRGFYNSAIETAYTENQKSIQTHLAEEHDTNVTKLKDMWGADTQSKVQIALDTAKGFLSQETLDYLDATGLGNNAALVKDFYELSKRFSGDRKLIDGDRVLPEPLTLEAMESAAMKILKTPGWEKDPVLKKEYDKLTQQRADILYKEQ